ncbi:MAG: hypothetical protein V7L00_09035 [Nostoc sp.]|uniref:hypothetical protein n=1 Tax=Nostoc sp. TaxID=1180 RepID=UPI002FF68E11
MTVTVNNTGPIINNISGDTNIFEGAVANFSAIATERGNDITVPLSPPSPLAYPRPVPNQ